MDEEQEDRLSRVEKLTLRMSVIQTAIAVTGFFVAIIALYAALNEADAVRKQQQASVWPNMEYHQSFRRVPGDEALEITLINSGIGPARIGMIEFFGDGQPLKSWDDVVMFVAEQTDFGYNNESVAGRVIRAGDEISIFSISTRSAGNEAVAAFLEAAGQQRITGRLCYCSVFAECWMLQSHARDPEPIQSCPAQDASNQF